MRGHFDTAKNLIENGSEVITIWDPWMIENKATVYTLINNFHDPFYQRYKREDLFTKSRAAILIENGMI